MCPYLALITYIWAYFMEILNFKELGDTESVVTNAVVLVLGEYQISIQQNLSSRDTATRGHPVISGHFLRTVSYFPNVKEPVMEGHPSCRDTFSRILRCFIVAMHCMGYLPSYIIWKRSVECFFELRTLRSEI